MDNTKQEEGAFNLLALDPSFRNVGWSVFKVLVDPIKTQSTLEFIKSGLIHTADARPKTKPRIASKIVKSTITGLDREVKVKAKRKGSASDEYDRCLVDITQAICGLMDGFNIQLVTAEIPTGSKNAKTALQLGMSVSNVITVVETYRLFRNANIQLVRCLPTEIKKVASTMIKDTPELFVGEDVDYKNPSKEHIMKCIDYSFPLAAQPVTRTFLNGRKPEIIADKFEHIADSVMVALTKKWVNYV